MLFGQKKLVGLDIGSTTIKIAELDVSRKGAVLRGFTMMPTPLGAVQGGDLAEPTMVGQAVAQAVKELNTKRKSACIGLWGSSAIVKKIVIPRMDEELVSEQIRWEAEQYIPFDMNEVNLDFKILRNTPSNSETMEILLVAARQEAIVQFAEAATSGGLGCEVLDLGGFALANCFERNYGVSEGQALGLINVGASISNFVVVENGEVVFCRDIPIGGGNYTSDIQKGMGISPDEAEAMKISASMGQPVPDEVATLLQQTHEIVAEEIGGSVDFYLSAGQGNPISRFFVTGGGAKAGGFLNFLSQALQHPCEIFDPFLKIQVDEKKFSMSYISEIRDFASVALGLGMRQAGDS